jgi:hypothetical protein
MGAESTAALQRGLVLTGWTVVELWTAAIGIGGWLSLREVAAITAGDRAATRSEHDTLAAALNDHFIDQGQNHPVKSWDDLATQ